jgi:hypothetical protein
MSKYTKEQRAAIYLEAYNILKNCVFEINPITKDKETYSNGRYACHAIAMAVDKLINNAEQPSANKYDSVANQIDFPEFYLFRDSILHLWLSHGDEEEKISPYQYNGNKLRQVVLLFCYEMCN